LQAHHLAGGISFAADTIVTAAAGDEDTAPPHIEQRVIGIARCRYGPALLVLSSWCVLSIAMHVRALAFGARQGAVKGVVCIASGITRL